ncbi:hypothetical protein BGW37DRAFT_524047 [Umbelopsis sp. PMI_123]|nr:hypothetical protein BGW37DRAFT_524047 [Umbelopsis sp. PMI_123]
MPILQHSQIPLPPVPVPLYDSKRKHKEVWYLPSTNEIFTDYETYIERLMQYRLPQWQCERTGRADLTYDQALESEYAQDSRAEYRFSFSLAKRVFQCVQFETSRLDTVVEHVFDKLCSQYEVGEYINCLWDDGIAYNARILEIIPPAVVNKATNGTSVSIVSDHTSDVTESDDDRKDQVARSTQSSTTTLKFPDAFLLPEPEVESTPPPQTQSLESYFMEEESEASTEMFNVQLVDADGEGIEECVKCVHKGDIRRDRFYFSKPLIKRLIRECMTKENYVGAPWILKPSIAEHYGIDITMPYHLQVARDIAYNKTRKRKMFSDSENERKAPMDATQRERLKEEKERIREERRQQAAIKYPIEDIDLPIYRKDPVNNWQLMDMSLVNNTLPCPIPYPSGGRPPRPVAWKEFTVPAEYFESYIMIWIFLSTFAEPLNLEPFTIDDFESGLCQNTSKSHITISSFSCLLNAIVRERKNGVLPGCIAGGPAANVLSSRSTTPNRAASTPKLEKLQTADSPMDIDRPEMTSENGNGNPTAEVDESSETSTPDPNVPERGQGSADVLKVAKNWDNREIRSDRRGWESTLIGCLNELATPYIIPDLDEILNHLVPRTNCTIADREKAFISLDVTHKIHILEFLVNAVNECSLIKEYMEQCQEQLTELRRQKIDLNRENKRILASKMALNQKEKEDQEEEEEEEKEDGDESGDNADESDAAEDDADSQHMSDSEMASRNESSNSDDDEDGTDNENSSRSAQRTRYDKSHQSRQAKLKRQQQKRQELEALRVKNYREEREKAKIKNQQAKAKAEERKQLEDDEKAQHEKEGQIEKDMRRYMTLRIRPLGRDRFYNRYFYLDNIGGAVGDGSGRLYIQNPSYADIRLILNRKPTELAGYGSETQQFFLELMKQQGFDEESEWFEHRLQEIAKDDDNTASHPIASGKGWWMYYSQPEEIDALLLWLNPKGVREHRLRNEITKQYNSIVQGMKNHQEAQNPDNVKPSRPRTRYGPAS